MIAFDNILVSDDVVSSQFVCDLASCKGGCCEEGDAGAPLSDEELAIITNLFEIIKPYLTQEALHQIEVNGKYIYNKEFGWVTPTLPGDNEICVYGYRDKNGIIKCAFEQAYYDGKIQWKKPVSCHLFPIIAKKSKDKTTWLVNYVPREILCRPACVMGEHLKVPVYEFLKEPLIRKFGKDFYEALEATAKTFFKMDRQVEITERD
ncbi:MAG TPA: DUF3109 family protein [Chitinophagaceae bacterium]|nr:DUF3109 family protein [Chitinophagaceae bacterium]